MSDTLCLSLGVTPYPGIKVDHNFYSMIEGGFKMECPYYASDIVWVESALHHYLMMDKYNFHVFLVQKKAHLVVWRLSFRHLSCLTLMCAGVLTFTFSCRYGMMCKCWALDPGSRPSFSQLVSFMCDQLTDREEKVGCPSPLIYPFFLLLTPLFLRQLYHNMLEQTNGKCVNASATKAVSALEAQGKNVAANEYCQAHSATESKEQTLELEDPQRRSS